MTGKKTIALIAAFCFAGMAIHAEIPANEVSFPVVIPPPVEASILDGILTGNDDGARYERRAKTMRIAGQAGIATGVVLALCGFAAMYRAADENTDVSAVHGGIGLILSGSLIAAIASSPARMHAKEEKLTELK